MYWKFKMAERIFTDQEEFEISKNYLNGKSLGDLAKEKNSSVCAISGALRRQKTSTRSTTEATKIREYNETFDDIQKAKIVKLYKNGLSLFKIATSYSVAYGTIERVLKKKNIKIRSKKELKSNKNFNIWSSNKKNTAPTTAPPSMRAKATGKV